MTIVIAEIGINHNGSLDLAKKLMDAAKAAGADYCKFQKRTIDIVYEGHLDDPRESPWGTTLGEQKRGLEFGEKEYDEIDNYSKWIGLPWFASAWDIESLAFLSKYKLPYNKVASAMLTNEQFLWAVRRDDKPIIMSTGMCTVEQLWDAACILKPEIIMHCVGQYPCPESDLNLMAIKALQNTFADWGVKIGYSGHEASVSPSVIAVALGAVAVERHITLDRSMYGSDQAASLEPNGFKSMVEQIRKIPIIMGDGIKRITEGEAAVAKKLRYWELATKLKDQVGYEHAPQSVKDMAERDIVQPSPSKVCPTCLGLCNPLKEGSGYCLTCDGTGRVNV